MTKLKGGRLPLRLVERRAERARPVKPPPSLPVPLRKEFAATVRAFQAQGIYRDTLRPSLEHYFLTLHLVRAAAAETERRGLFDGDGVPTPAALMLTRTMPILRAAAAALGITAHARLAGASARPNDDETGGETSGSPWTHAMRDKARHDPAD
ncbi:MAG TPA: hypothetical protein VIT62_10010 [Lysobacter sp.]